MEIALVLLQVLSTVVLLDVVLSWVVPASNVAPRSLTNAIAEPLCRPFRALFPAEEVGVDISPLLAMVSLNTAGYLVRTLMVSGL